jgi:hypothetical protein
MTRLGLIVGLAAVAMAGTANAATIFDTLTGQSGAVVGSTLLAAGKFKEPLGDDFSVPFTETIQSVSVDLSSSSANGKLTDTGSVLLYLVQANPTTGLPQVSSGTTLLNPIFLGTIPDSLITGSTTSTLVNTISLATNVTIGAGTWSLELTSASDPNNFHITPNPVASTVKFDAIPIGSPGILGLPSTQFVTSGSDGVNGTTIVGGVSVNPGSASGTTVFAAQINAPEPASLSLIGAGLIGLGMIRRRKANKTA